MNEKLLKGIKDALELIALFLFFNVLATQCSGPSMDRTERTLEKIEHHLETISKKN